MGFLSAFFSGGVGFGVLSALMGSTSTIFYRKAIAIWPYGRSSFVLFGNWIGTMMAIGILLFGNVNWGPDIEWYVVPVFLILAFSMFHNGNRIMELNRNEKLSTLQIFGNIATILTIVAGFFLYGKTSVYTLGIAILCGAILFGTQFFEGGGFCPPKNWKPIVTTYLIGGIQSLAIVWMVAKIGYVGYFVISSFAATITAVMVLLFQKKMGEAWLGTRQFYVYRTVDGVIFNSVRFIYFFLVGSLGPVVTTLLGMIGNITTLIFGRLFLGEKNSAKEWGINILLCVLVGLGFYLKDR
jgi:hypothetical protein